MSDCVCVCVVCATTLCVCAICVGGMRGLAGGAVIGARARARTRNHARTNGLPPRSRAHTHAQKYTQNPHTLPHMHARKHTQTHNRKHPCPFPDPSPFLSSVPSRKHVRAHSRVVGTQQYESQAKTLISNKKQRVLPMLIEEMKRKFCL